MNSRRYIAKYILVGFCVSAILSVLATVIALRDWAVEYRKEVEAFRSLAETMSRAVDIKIAARLGGVSALRDALVDRTIDPGASFSAAAGLVQASAGGFLAINLVDADRRIVQVWPEESNRDALGRVIGQTQATIDLLDQAMNENRAMATGIVDLFQGGQGVAVYFPIRRDGAFAGFLNAVFRLGDLDADLAAIVPAGVKLYFAGAGHPSDHSADVRDAGLNLTMSFHQRLLNQVFHIDVELAGDPTHSTEHLLALGWQIFLCVMVGLSFAGYLIWARRSRGDEALLASILRSSPIAFVSVDNGGKIVRFNPAAEAMFGFRSAQVLSQSIGMLVPRLSRTKHDKLVADFFRSNVEHKYMGDWRDIVAVRADGSQFHVSVLLTKSVVGGDPITTAMLTDMTGEQIRQRDLMRLVNERAIAADKAEAANRAKSMFLASMSHELRTPLNAIIGFSDLINRELFGRIEPPKYREYLHDIHDSAQGLLALINDILDFSKMEAGVQTLNDEAFDVGSVIEPAIRTAAGIANDKSVAIRFERQEPPTLARGDPRATRQVILNLLSNAIKFSPRGAEIFVRSGADAARNEVFVEVEDRGHGIAPRDLENLGKPFYQAQENSFIATQGTGLGLAICFGLMRSMNGRIAIDSALGRGTTVRAVFKAPEKA